ncbi:MAG: hypothetical protein PGN25_11970 [Methylorubrum populi]
MNGNEGEPPSIALPDHPAAEPSARFGRTGPGRGTVIQTVHLETEEVNINQSSLGALERMASHSPHIAEKLIESTNFVVKHDTKRFLGGAIVAGIVACTVLVCSTVTMIYAGFWHGIGLFMSSVVVSAIIVVALTGRVTDISWVVKVLPGQGEKSKKDHAED